MMRRTKTTMVAGPGPWLEWGPALRSQNPPTQRHRRHPPPPVHRPTMAYITGTAGTTASGTGAAGPDRARRGEGGHRQQQRRPGH